MKKHNIVIVILIVGFVGVFVAYKMYNKPHVNVVDTKSDVTLSASKIMNDFSSDENAANKLYLEKIIKIDGTISELNMEKEMGIITLKTTNDFGSVLCHLSQEGLKKMNSIKVGEIITIKGICKGFLMDVILVKCEIIS
jgi:DNA/RNA endonuclease YhcR with UshA esterase domain